MPGDAQPPQAAHPHRVTGGGQGQDRIHYPIIDPRHDAVVAYEREATAGADPHTLAPLRQRVSVFHAQSEAGHHGLGADTGLNPHHPRVRRRPQRPPPGRQVSHRAEVVSGRGRTLVVLVPLHVIAHEREADPPPSQACASPHTPGHRHHGPHGSVEDAKR